MLSSGFAEVSTMFYLLSLFTNFRYCQFESFKAKDTLIYKQYFFFLKVCLEKLNDIQLALVIARLYESEFDTSATYKSILRKKILGIDSPVSELNMLNINMHYDPFLRSMAYWILEDYSSALETLIKQPVTKDDGKQHF